MPLSEEKSPIHRFTHENGLATVSEVHVSMATLEKKKISENEQGRQDPHLKSMMEGKANTSVARARLSSRKSREDSTQNPLK